MERKRAEPEGILRSPLFGPAGLWLLEKEVCAEKKAAPQFYPLTISTGNEANRNSTRTGLQVHLKNDRFRIEIGADFSPEALKNLITILEQM